MTYSQKYTLVYFITPLKNGVEFHMSNWPLHVTLADTFAMDGNKADIAAKLAELIADIDSARTTALKDTVLGTTPVVLLDKTIELQQLHETLANVLEKNGVVFNHPEFIHDGFLPHSTIQGNERLRPGDKILIDNLSLIDMFPSGDWQQRKVLATSRLN